MFSGLCSKGRRLLGAISVSFEKPIPKSKLCPAASNTLNMNWPENIEVLPVSFLIAFTSEDAACHTMTLPMYCRKTLCAVTN